jgi:transposase
MEMTMARQKPPDYKELALRQSGTLNPHPQNVRDPIFQESDFFDPRDMIQVKYEMIRRVQENGQNIAAVAASFGFSRPSFYKARVNFQREGLYGLFPKKRGPRARHKLTDEVMRFLQETQSEQDHPSPRVLAGKLREQFGLRIHPRTIERALKRMKKKRP